ncbi:uncharacterized protein LOC144437450 [Glandiceps talaboti]
MSSWPFASVLLVCGLPIILCHRDVPAWFGRDCKSKYDCLYQGSCHFGMCACYKGYAGRHCQYAFNIKKTKASTTTPKVPISSTLFTAFTENTTLYSNFTTNFTGNFTSNSTENVTDALTTAKTRDTRPRQKVTKTTGIVHGEDSFENTANTYRFRTVMVAVVVVIILSICTSCIRFAMRNRRRNRQNREQTHEHPLVQLKPKPEHFEYRPTWYKPFDHQHIPDAFEAYRCSGHGTDSDIKEHFYDELELTLTPPEERPVPGPSTSSFHMKGATSLRHSPIENGAIGGVVYDSYVLSDVHKIPISPEESVKNVITSQRDLRRMSPSVSSIRNDSRKSVSCSDLSDDSDSDDSSP